MPTPVQGEIKSPQKEKEGINHKEHKGHKEGLCIKVSVSPAGRLEVEGGHRVR